MVKVRDGSYLYCERHKGWFFSTVHARSKGKKYPSQCPICKNQRWDEVKTR